MLKILQHYDNCFMLLFVFGEEHQSTFLLIYKEAIGRNGRMVFELRKECKRRDVSVLDLGLIIVQGREKLHFVSMGVSLSL